MIRVAGGREGGIYLPDFDLWMDSRRSRRACVVSHAHGDHTAAHHAVLSTRATAALLRCRGVSVRESRIAAYGSSMEWGGARVTLYPAGHVRGSALVLVDDPGSGSSLLYSGDFRVRPGLTAEPLRSIHADVLVMETTFGKPRYRFPDPERVVRELIKWCSETLASGETPVLLCYSLGKGQELTARLRRAPFPIYLHPEHWRLASLYRDLGVVLPPHRPYQPGQKLDGALLCSPQARSASWFLRLKRPRLAWISGWALDSWRVDAMGVDRAFPLSDHADYDELLEFVGQVGPRKVWTLHGFAREFAADLRRRGFDADPLEPYRGQLSLFTLPPV